MPNMIRTHRDEALPKGWRLVFLRETDSTNEEIKRRRNSDPGEGFVIVAGSQTAGRGRRGRSWESPEGNLFLSIRLRQSAQGVADSASLSFIAALALLDAFSSMAPALDVALKWPNDVLVSGAKVSGILLETDTPWIIVGVGVNVLHRPQVTPTNYPVTSLAEQGISFSALDVASFFCHALYGRLRQWREEGFVPIRQAWKSKACGLGGSMVANLPDGSSVCGIFSDLDADGALVLHNEAGQHRILAADVFFG
ncbi:MULTISPECIES: biotin--[acetyl-CoA-carboxylase] ligase [unclassified Haematospirillum]|uniref:biotin--[acetyl-CoA-carboxylase] ligase n=1 Tax=unclassified Haematospirillum TaxID=2622088 RepID=UPI001FD75E34|nr:MULTISPECIES: biotin--[acetyl-CoA-carboxylase] ligase [unclassified Haematospirillum]